MNHFIRNGSMWNVTPRQDLDIHDCLPGGNYTVGQIPTGIFVLNEVSPFTIPDRIYGDAQKQAERILNTYLDRTASTGALLAGEKGSGKTMVGKLVCHLANQQGIPTIIINHPWFGDGFNKFVQSIEQRAIVFFDEFEKTYDREQQESLLTLLDGVFPQSKLFLLTCNDRFRVSLHMTNRPGRIYYLLEYQGLDADFVREYCLENLKNQAQVDGVCRVATLFSQFNFDMLKCIVEEMNRYNESPLEVMRFLNTKADSDAGGTYEMKLLFRGEPLPEIYPVQHTGNPRRQGEFTITEYYRPADADPEAESEEREHVFTMENLAHIDPRSATFTYQKGELMLQFTRRKLTRMDLAGGYSEFFE